MQSNPACKQLDTALLNWKLEEAEFDEQQMHVIQILISQCWKFPATVICGMSLSEAIEKLRHSEFEGGRTIEVRISFYREGNIDIEFSVDANQQWYKNSTLEGAINACLVSNKVFGGSEEEAARVVAEAERFAAEKL